MQTLTSGSGKAALQPLFKFAEEIHHAFVVEGQHLREDGARDVLDRINPEIAIKKSCPAGAAGASAVGPWPRADAVAAAAETAPVGNLRREMRSVMAMMPLRGGGRLATWQHYLSATFMLQ